MTRWLASVIAFVGTLVCLAALTGCSGPPYLPARATPPPPAAPPGVEHKVAFFEGARSTPLFSQSWRPESDHVRATVVIVHGLKDHSSRYAEVAARLVAEGYAVHALDLRGHAHSAGVRVGLESFDDYLADLDIFLARVRAEETVRPLFLFGHSMGGAITTLYTIKRKPDITGLMLSGAALTVNVNGFKVLGTKMVAGLSPNAGVFDLDFDQFSRDPKVVAACKADPLVYQEGGPAKTARELLRAIDTVEDRMKEVSVPLLIMHGAADEVTDPDGSRNLFKQAASTDKVLHIYPKLVHDLLHEPEKEAVVADMVQWLDKRAPLPPARPTLPTTTPDDPDS